MKRVAKSNAHRQSPHQTDAQYVVQAMCRNTQAVVDAIDRLTEEIKEAAATIERHKLAKENRR